MPLYLPILELAYNEGNASPFVTGGTFSGNGRTLADINTNVWTGCSGTTTWETPSNWSLGTIPNLHNVIIPDVPPAATEPTISTTGGVISSLILEEGSILNLADGGELDIDNLSGIAIDIELNAVLNIDLGANLYINESAGTAVNVNGTLHVDGQLFITTDNIGINVSATGTIENDGLIEITEGLGLEKSEGVITVVNFLEIQSGGTFTVKAGGSLIIDGADGFLAKKSTAGVSDGDTGIKIFNGGTFICEATGTVEVVNLSGTGIDNNGTVNTDGDMTITIEDIGIQTSSDFTNGGDITISKMDGISKAASAKTGGATVVNFLEIQSGGTFTVAANGKLTIDGTNTDGTVKTGLVNTDIGINIAAGGTFTSEANTDTQILNINGNSTGVESNGTVINDGTFNVTSDNVGVQIQSGTFTNNGNVTIDKPVGLVFGAKTGGATVVNFLEIQSGGTFTVAASGSLVINGEENVLKSGVAASNDVGHQHCLWRNIDCS